MDRLICGDVGYGKTEIAVRAAFKAVQDGKQVAVLVPTTLLVQQHHATFADRYAGFPVKVGAAEPVPDRRRDQGDRSRGSPTARSTSWSAPTGCSAARSVQGPRPGDHRRGAAVRRRAQGAAEAAADGRRRAGHVGHADPAHAGDGDHRHPGDEHDHHPAGGTAPGAHLRRPVRRRPGRPRRSAASCCARARSSTSTTGCRASTRWPSGSPSWCPRPGSSPRTAR